MMNLRRQSIMGDPANQRITIIKTLIATKMRELLTIRKWSATEWGRGRCKSQPASLSGQNVCKTCNFLISQSHSGSKQSQLLIPLPQETLKFRRSRPLSKSRKFTCIKIMLRLQWCKEASLLWLIGWREVVNNLTRVTRSATQRKDWRVCSWIKPPEEASLGHQCTFKATSTDPFSKQPLQPRRGLVLASSTRRDLPCY